MNDDGDISIYKNLLKFKLWSNIAKEKIILADFSSVKFGLADRFIGILSLYMLAKETGRTLKIYHTKDFLLEKYLLPNKVNWIIKSKEIAYGLNESRPLISSLSRNSLRLIGIPDLNPRVKQYHAYTNMDFRDFIQNDRLNRYNRCELFKELFVFSPHLQSLVDTALILIGTHRFIAVHLRFLNMLEGVEPDAMNKEGDLSKKNKIKLINKCKKIIHGLHNQYPDIDILLISDSNTFLEEAFPSYVKILPGRVGHISSDIMEKDSIVDKAFTDMFLLTKAEFICNITGCGLRKSGFSKMAAEFGGIPFKTIEIED